MERIKFRKEGYINFFDLDNPINKYLDYMLEEVYKLNEGQSIEGIVWGFHLPKETIIIKKEGIHYHYIVKEKCRLPKLEYIKVETSKIEETFPFNSFFVIDPKGFVYILRKINEYNGKTYFKFIKGKIKNLSKLNL